jgi:putative transposase
MISRRTPSTDPNYGEHRNSDFANFLSEATDAEMITRLRCAETIGQPLGSRKFLVTLERKTRWILSPAKRGPKPLTEDSVH